MVSEFKLSIGACVLRCVTFFEEEDLNSHPSTKPINLKFAHAKTLIPITVVE